MGIRGIVLSINMSQLEVHVINKYRFVNGELSDVHATYLMNCPPCNQH